jgi:hypothetical protein
LQDADGDIGLGRLFVAFRGRGYVAGLITCGCLLAMDGLCGLSYRDAEYYARHGWPKLAAFVLAALVVWCLNSMGREEKLGIVEYDTARRPFFRKQDSFFFVPVQYWPLLLCVLGGVFYFVRS